MIFIINLGKKEIQSFSSREEASQYLTGQWWAPDVNVSKDFTIIEGDHLVLDPKITVDVPHERKRPRMMNAVCPDCQSGFEANIREDSICCPDCGAVFRKLDGEFHQMGEGVLKCTN